MYSQPYKLSLEVAALGVLAYIGITDFRTFKIRNEAVLLLLMLYVLFALAVRSWFDILLNVLFAATMFIVLLWCYAKKVVGGGDVKFMTTACLWVGGQSGLMFSIFLLTFIALHLGAVKIGWAKSKIISDRLAIPYAPSIAGALGALIVLGYL
jgi:prepilin peptidase CpaA